MIEVTGEKGTAEYRTAVKLANAFECIDDAGEGFGLCTEDVLRAADGLWRGVHGQRA